MKVFYHNDADGKCAADLIWRRIRPGSPDGDAEYIEMDYDKVFPLGDVYLKEEVWIVDFSIEPDMMTALLKVTDNVTWIDHHVSSIKKYEFFQKEIRGLRSEELSGCELTYRFISSLVNDFTGLVPRYIRLIGDRDTWTFEYGNDSRYMHEAFKAAGEPPPGHWWWDVVDSSELKGELIKGKLLLDSTRAFYKAIVDRSAYEAVFEGHTILVCNCPIFTSEIFGDRVKDYPFVAVYCHNGTSWKVSLYSENMDVVEYAKSRGGGGHKRACGFISNEVPFSKQ